MSPQSDFPPNSLFAPGSNILITGGSFVQNIQLDVTKVLSPLYDKVSPNAILNAGGRADAVRCYPGTREEIISRIEKWYRSDHPQGHPIFWLSGPAGAGKSAIVQTIAERCIEGKVPMANFFFFRADATRNRLEPVVATILFQLFELFPALKARVVDIATNNPVIFRQSMQVQFSTLIETPLRAIRHMAGQKPSVLLIDGLDECDGKSEQITLLRDLHDIATKIDPPFIVIVASRTEAHLTMTFNDIGTSSESIYLDDSYRPVNDIRLFLSEEFSKIRRTHGLRHTLNSDWPLAADFNSILNKSSGQFIFAATVIRFIASSAASPKRSLEIALGLRPVTKISPFVTLDSLYAHILSQVEDWKSLRDVLAAHKIASQSFIFLTSILSPLGYTEDDIVSTLADSASIIQFKAGDRGLTVFHASLDDFLHDKSRAGELYIDTNVFARKLAPLHFKYANNFGCLEYAFRTLSFVTEPNEELDTFLGSYLPDPDLNQFLDYDLSPRDQDEWMDIIVTLYQTRDPQLCSHIKDRWDEWFASWKQAIGAVNF